MGPNLCGITAVVPAFSQKLKVLLKWWEYTSIENLKKKLMAPMMIGLRIQGSLKIEES